MRTVMPDQRLETRTASTPAVGTDPRASMASLPKVLQYPLTVLTGKPLNGQVEFRWWTPSYHFAAAVASVLAGLALGAYAWVSGGRWTLLLLPSWALTTHGLRNLRMMIFHQCSHRNMYRRHRLDQFIGRVLASVLLVQNHDRYQREHVRDHHAARHMTLQDPTVQVFLLTLELRPGMTTSEMWRRMWWKTFSPRFHLQFAAGRIRSFWSEASGAERVTFSLLYGSMLVLLGATGALLPAAVLWGLPLFPFFQMSNIWRLCVEHRFPSASSPETDRVAALSTAVFLGEPVPSETRRGRRLLAWCRWWRRLLLVHGPARLLVLTADTVVHDFHHRHPRSSEWHRYLFARHRDAALAAESARPYTEHWGLRQAIEETFASLRDADQAIFDVDELLAASGRARFLAFDD